MLPTESAIGLSLEKQADSSGSAQAVKSKPATNIFSSKPLCDYICESNKGTHLNLVTDEEEAVWKLGGKAHAKSEK